MTNVAGYKFLFFRAGREGFLSQAGCIYLLPPKGTAAKAEKKIHNSQGKGEEEKSRNGTTVLETVTGSERQRREMKWLKG